MKYLIVTSAAAFWLGAYAGESGPKVLTAHAPTCWVRVSLDGAVTYASEGCMRISAKRWERVRLNHSPLTAEQRRAKP